MNRIEFSTFKFERIIFQLKYPPAPLIFDKTGKIWKENLVIFPTLKIISAEPNKSSFVIDRDAELFCEIDNFRISYYEPKASLTEFIGVAKPFYEICTRVLEIEEFSRLGLRLYFFKEFDSIEQASEIFAKSNLLKLPSSSEFMDIEGKVSLPDMAFIWENDNLGCMVHIKVESRKLRLEAPLNFRFIQPTLQSQHGILIDVDYFTKSSVTASQLEIETWIKQGIQRIKAQIDRFISG